MPIYEYSCTKCNSEFELLIRNESDKPSCPECGNEKVAKQFSVPAASTGSNQLPMAGGNCGRPQCGTGGCQGMM